MPYKSFVDGDVLTAQEVNEYWMQGVIVFDDATARDAALTSPTEGQVAYLKDTNAVTFYNGSTWSTLSFIGPAVLSGGTTATYSSGGNNYRTHTFTSTGTLTCSTAGIADILLIGPGGPGKIAFNDDTAGGGGGGFVEMFNVYIPAGSHEVRVDDPGLNWFLVHDRITRFLDIVAFSGGAGNPDPISDGRSAGASGGGTRNSGFSGRVAGQGNVGASGLTDTGGGGAGGAASGATGGAGKASSMSGTSVTYSRGGNSSSNPASSGTNPGDGGSALTGDNNAEQLGTKGIAIIRVKRVN